jgi:hypothetical protein
MRDSTAARAAVPRLAHLVEPTTEAEVADTAPAAAPALATAIATSTSTTGGRP